MAAPGTRWRQPAPVCVALALAAHAALLVGMATPVQNGAGARDGAPHAVRARTLTEVLPAPADSPPASTSAQAPGDEAPTVAAAAGPDTRSADSSEQPEAAVTEGNTPPVFAANALPPLDNPDAPLPPEGVRLRVFVQLDAKGMPADVIAGAPPGEPAPDPAFQKAAARALRQAQLQAGSDPTYCFLVRFDASAPTPQLAWLPGAARDAARCLTGKQPPPRDIPSAAAAP